MNAGTPRLIIALDYAEQTPAWRLIEQLDPSLCRLKIGKEMFTRFGPDFVRQAIQQGFDIFLDLKYHDIPNTVAAACDAAADLGVWMLNLHASGGRKMMEAAMNRLAQHQQAPLVIGVTILTALDDSDLVEIGYQGTAQANVNRLATLAADSGLNGVVCSPLEANALRQQHPESFLLVTPGIRAANDPKDDQIRKATPADAIKNGASHLVIGRPVTQAANPQQALMTIHQAVTQALPDQP